MSEADPRAQALVALLRPQIDAWMDDRERRACEETLRTHNGLLPALQVVADDKRAELVANQRPWIRACRWVRGALAQEEADDQQAYADALAKVLTVGEQVATLHERLVVPPPVGDVEVAAVLAKLDEDALDSLPYGDGLLPLWERTQVWRRRLDLVDRCDGLVRLESNTGRILQEVELGVQLMVAGLDDLARDVREQAAQGSVDVPTVRRTLVEQADGAIVGLAAEVLAVLVAQRPA